VDERIVVSVCRWWFGGSLESVIQATASKRRRLFVVAISGHKGGPAALGQRGSSFFFLLRVRIFIGLSVASIAASSPSGFVPDGSSGGHAGESTIIGIDQGLDRVFEFSSGVFVVKLRDSVEFPSYYLSFLGNHSLHIRGRPRLILGVHFCFKICAGCLHCRIPLQYMFLFSKKTTLIYRLFAIRSLCCKQVPYLANQYGFNKSVNI
jgi:hypothetical protein